MRVLYVSKALVSAAHHDKPKALSQYCEVVAVTPDRWATRIPERSMNGTPIRWERAWFSGSNHFHVYPRAAAILDEVRPSLVHVDEEPYSAVTWQFARLCRERDIPFVFFAWQNIAKQLPPPFQTMRRRVCELAAGGIAGTPEAFEVLRRLGYRGPATVIPQFGVDPHLFYPHAGDRRNVRESWRVGDDRFVIGFVGRLVPEKGVATLIQAVSQIPGTDLAIVGDGPERNRLITLARRLGCSERVRFLGTVPSLAVGRLLRGLDVLVLPSRASTRWAEQFGRVIVEAMATEIPVIASRSGSIPWVVGDAAILTPSEDAEALRTAIRELMAAPDRRTELAQRGRDMVTRRFTTAVVVRHTFEWYCSLLSGSVAGKVGVS